MSPSMTDACGTSDRISRLASGIAVEPPVRNTAVMSDGLTCASRMVCADRCGDPLDVPGDRGVQPVARDLGGELRVRQLHRHLGG